MPRLVCFYCLDDRLDHLVVYVVVVVVVVHVVVGRQSLVPAPWRVLVQCGIIGQCCFLQCRTISHIPQEQVLRTKGWNIGKQGTSMAIQDAQTHDIAWQTLQRLALLHIQGGEAWQKGGGRWIAVVIVVVVVVIVIVPQLHEGFALYQNQIFEMW